MYACTHEVMERLFGEGREGTRGTGSGGRGGEWRVGRRWEGRCAKITSSELRDKAE